MQRVINDYVDTYTVPQQHRPGNGAEMARTFKITGYMVDANDDYDEDDLQRIIEGHTDLFGNLKIVASSEWEWGDDCPENYKTCSMEDYERRFN